YLVDRAGGRICRVRGRLGHSPHGLGPLPHLSRSRPDPARRKLPARGSPHAIARLLGNEPGRLFADLPDCPDGWRRLMALQDGKRNRSNEGVRISRAVSPACRSMEEGADRRLQSRWTLLSGTRGNRAAVGGTPVWLQEDPAACVGLAAVP